MTAALVLGAHAAGAQDLAMAEKLFAEGRALMKSGDTAKACEKFQASHDIDKTATGTLLNLALCHEAIGKNATAWAEFRQVIAESPQREDRIVLAREHEAKLFPKLAYVVIAVRPAARVEGLRITLDSNRPVASAAWGEELPIDPGHHTFDVAASGMLTKRYDLDVPVDRAGDQTLDIAPLERDPTKSRTTAIDESASRAEEERLHRRRNLAYLLGGVGIVSAGAGAVFGGLAIDQNNKKNAACGATCADSNQEKAAHDALDRAKTYALVSDITIGAGAALLVAGGILFFTSSPKPSAASTDPTSVRITAGAHSAGLALERSW
jgi:hypothetical protein